jgi:peroxiredoxin
MRTTRLAAQLSCWIAIASLGACVAQLALLTRVAQAGLDIPPAIEGRNLADASSLRIPTADPSHLTVVVFLSARCPCSASHEPTLSTLAKEFGKDARFVGIHSNTDEPEAESAAYFKRAALPFPVIQDADAKLAERFGALKTPHAYVLGKDGKLLYQGGVDDSHTSSKATRPFLKTALEALRAGRAPEITRSRAIGCVIRR